MGRSSHEIVCPLCGGGGKVVLNTVVSLTLAKPTLRPPKPSESKAKDSDDRFTVRKLLKMPHLGTNGPYIKPMIQTLPGAVFVGEPPSDEVIKERFLSKYGGGEYYVANQRTGKILRVARISGKVKDPYDSTTTVLPPRKKPPHEWVAVSDYGRKRWLSRKAIDHILSMKGTFSATQVRSYLARSKLHKTENPDGLVVLTSAYLRALVREGKVVRIRKNCYTVNRYD